MGPVAQVVSPGVALVVACVLAVCAGVAVAWGRASRRRREAFDAALDRSRHEVELLSRKVAELSDEVVRARRTADQDREYVITSLESGESGTALGGTPLGTATAESRRPLARPTTEPGRPPVGRVLEDQLVEALARQPRTSKVRARAVELAVRSVALGHGVRRALSADVLDRAAAEAHVARRRSRRERKRQLRDARRVVSSQRQVQEPGQEVA